MAGIFISYRRSDSAVAAGRLADDLSEAFGRDSIFRDVDTMAVGEDYEQVLERALDSCAVLIAVIGPQWSTVADESGRRRLEDPRDWIRIEIGRALARGVRVIPILISATMPREAEMPADLQPLLKRQALELTDRHWRQDLQLLAQALEKVPGIARRAPAPIQATPVTHRRIVWLAAAVVASAATLVTALYSAGMFGTPPTKQPTATVSADSSLNADSQGQQAPSQQTASVSAMRVDRVDARSTANAILTAYRARDVIALAGLSDQGNKRIFVELAEQGEAHPRYDSIFDGLQWQIVQGWDGTLTHARYRHYVGAAGDTYEAQVKFANMGLDEVGVVVMTWEDDKWSFEDINSPSPEVFMSGSETFKLSPEPY